MWQSHTLRVDPLPSEFQFPILFTPPPMAIENVVNARKTLKKKKKKSSVVALWRDHFSLEGSGEAFWERWHYNQTRRRHKTPGQKLPSHGIQGPGWFCLSHIADLLCCHSSGYPKPGWTTLSYSHSTSVRLSCCCTYTCTAPLHIHTSHNVFFKTQISVFLRFPKPL